MFTINKEYSNYSSSQLVKWGNKEVGAKEINAKRRDIGFIIEKYQDIIDFFENLDNFDEDDIDYPVMSLVYNMSIEAQKALMQQHETYPFKLDAATTYDV